MHGKEHYFSMVVKMYFSKNHILTNEADHQFQLFSYF